MTATKTDLDGGIARLMDAYKAETAKIAAIDTMLDKFIADYATKTGVDLTDELAAVTTMTNQVVTNAALLDTESSKVTTADV